MRGNDVMLSSATLRDEERRAKLARELEKAMTRATKARMKAEVLTYTVVSGRPVLRLSSVLLDKLQSRISSFVSVEHPLSKAF
jgi:crotonobetainyl-CoA:carnitine CoA-transferase CaiB-like acyl-CoA transferase